MIISRKMIYGLIATAFLLTFLVFEVPKGQYGGDVVTSGENVVGQGVYGTSDNIRSNVETTFNAEVNTPVSDKAFIDSKASVIGNVEIESSVYVAPFASIRGDEGQGLYIGQGSNIQDGVVIHALETENKGKPIPEHLVDVKGKKFAVYIGKNVSIAHQAQVHGPALIEDDVFIGMQGLVFNAKIGKGSVVEPGAKVIGVNVPANRYVTAGRVIKTQEAADKLPKITKNYVYSSMNEAVTGVNQELSEQYKNSN